MGVVPQKPKGIHLKNFAQKLGQSSDPHQDTICRVLLWCVSRGFLKTAIAGNSLAVPDSQRKKKRDSHRIWTTRGHEEHPLPQPKPAACRIIRRMLLQKVYLRTILFSEESQKPQPPLLLKKVLQYTSNLQYAPHLYCSAFGATELSRKGSTSVVLPFVSQCASHLYRDMSPICIAILWQNLGGCGHRDVPHFQNHYTQKQSNWNYEGLQVTACRSHQISSSLQLQSSCFVCHKTVTGYISEEGFLRVLLQLPLRQKELHTNNNSQRVILCNHGIVITYRKLLWNDFT